MLALGQAESLWVNLPNYPKTISVSGYPKNLSNPQNVEKVAAAFANSQYAFMQLEWVQKEYITCFDYHLYSPQDKQQILDHFAVQKQIAEKNLKSIKQQYKHYLAWPRDRGAIKQEFLASLKTHIQITERDIEFFRARCNCCMSYFTNDNNLRERSLAVLQTKINAIKDHYSQTLGEYIKISKETKLDAVEIPSRISF